MFLELLSAATWPCRILHNSYI